MKTKYIRELQLYTEDELCGILELSKSEFNQFAYELLKTNVLKMVTPENKDEYDIYCEENDSLADAGYVFRFVGLLLFKKCLVKVYPKCYSKSYVGSDGTSKFIDERMKTVLKVIERYNSHNGFKYKQQCTENEKHQNNYLGLMIYLLEDYYQNHLYNNRNEIYDVNGDGSIVWTKTIDEFTLPLGKPRGLNS